MLCPLVLRHCRAAFSARGLPSALLAKPSVNRLAPFSNDSGTSNDNSDWFSDYDPNQFADYEKNGHDYSRDTTKDNSNVDVDAVNKLLAERLQAKLGHDFETADGILKVLLKQHSVAVFDRERIWRTVKLSPTRPQRFLPKGNKMDFGPNGHDYHETVNAGPITSKLSLQEIHKLLAKRLEAKLRRDFETADRILYNLRDAGVYVNDHIREWRGDGKTYSDYGGSNREGKPGTKRTLDSRSDRNRPHTMSRNSLEMENNAQPRKKVESKRRRDVYKSQRDDYLKELDDQLDAILEKAIAIDNVSLEDGEPEKVP